eukprot:CAMPEP_0178918026 /NCGR_PEP_ID=MMETSP0786-20121207/13595_1 /TAXON_ID=186022 /ORGANISM="Thalassionema frauenfeldii, Strain CCMP 1798" /LENGTH=227 /DNA_ID=CAMNT_0020591685 /DNA_START=10 /DNA_END=693 /DNA_ORIENTATION=-
MKLLIASLLLLLSSSSLSSVYASSEGSCPDACKALVDQLLSSGDGTNTKTIDFIQSKTGETIQFTLDNFVPIKLSHRKQEQQLNSSGGSAAAAGAAERVCCISSTAPCDGGPDAQQVVLAKPQDYTDCKKYYMQQGGRASDTTVSFHKKMDGGNMGDIMIDMITGGGDTVAGSSSGRHSVDRRDPNEIIAYQKAMSEGNAELYNKLQQCLELSGSAKMECLKDINTA